MSSREIGLAVTAGADQTVSLDGEPAAERSGAFDEDWAEIGRYALVSELARGGGGRVAVAVDRKLGRRVALKRPLDADGSARLEREAFVLARLEHPSIVPIHDAGRDREGSPFYTMKLVDGETLAVRIDRASTFDDRLALLPTITAVADAMAYAHAQGVIHRDLKPGNVVVGAFGEVAVIDWGLGKLVDEPPEVPGSGTANDALTRHDAVVGTPAYMAPEQARGELVDRRADVYAIGAMLYHVLVGDLPYPRSSTDQVLALLRSSPPPPIDTREPRVPRDLAAIVGKAMAYAGGERYPSAAELADDLHRYQTGRLVAAHHYRPWTRAWRWLRRHQGRVALATGILALAAAGTVWATTDRAAVEPPCAGLDAPVVTAWNPVIAAPIARTFAASSVPGAVASWRIVGKDLDARAAQITAMRISACQMARVTGEQSGETLDLRMTCLDRRTAELGNFATWLATGDPAHAVEGLGSLGRVADCADVTRLHDVTPMPADPVARATIAAVHGDLDRAVASARDGKPGGSVEVFDALLARAQATGYEPLRARALFRKAQALVYRTRSAEAPIAPALTAAERAGDDRLRGDIVLLQLFTEVTTLHHMDGAEALVDQVSAIGERVHDPSYVSAALGYQVQLDIAHDHVAEAVRHAEEAVARLPEPNGRDAWPAQGTLAAAYGAARRPADARRILTQLIASRRAVIGDADEPNLANNLVNLAAVTDQLGDKPHAAELMATAAGMLDRTLPPDAKARMQAHSGLATLENGLGHHAEARKQLTALLPVAEAKLGHDHPMVADIVFRIAESHDDEHALEPALAGYRDALARFTAGKVPLWISKCHGHIGTVLLEQDQPKQALPELEAALAAMAGLRGEDSEDAALLRGDVGRTRLALGDLRGAIRGLERALATLDKGEDRADRGLYRLALANAHWNLGDKPLALDSARQARTLLESAGAEGKNGLADLDEWEHKRK